MSAVGELKVGDRVTLAFGEMSDVGEVQEFKDDGTIAVVRFDMDIRLKHLDVATLEKDAALPDPALALQKALHYKGQRDQLLRDAWEVADSVSEAGLARKRADAAAAASDRQLIREINAHAATLDRERQALKLLEGAKRTGLLDGYDIGDDIDKFLSGS